ncbi:MAG: hypothetical protein HS111_18740 [Kofleriaceae bacterium]|nr:hypothetical protein [Kofleriaceae bacterium]
MRNRIVAALAASALLGVGYLSAQPGDAPQDPPEAPTRDIADVSVPGEKKVDLSPREMTARGETMIKEMEGFHTGVLAAQAQAKKAKDVIKLNCVNESLLAVKQLLNIAEAAQTELKEAIAGGLREEQIHEYGKITIAHERASAARTESQNCIGEDLHFVGKNDVTVDGPAIPHDPTKDGDLGQDDGEDPFDDDVDLEDPAYASPFAPL